MIGNQILQVIDNAIVSPLYQDVHEVCSGKYIVVYGAGHGYDTLSVFTLEKYGYRPAVIVDKKFSGQAIYKGVPACSPSSELVTQLATKEDHLVIISIGHKHLHEGILKDLKILGFRNIIFAFDIYEYHLSHTPSLIYDQGVQYYKNNRQNILSAFNLLADETSQQVFTQVLRTHLSRQLYPIPARPLSEQYFPSDIRLLKGYARMINCGSYDGDTVKQLMATKGKIESLVCFEPDQKNYGQLVSFISSQGDKIADSVVTFPCGIFNQTTKLKFSGDNSVNSNLDENGKEIIQCVCLDDVLPRFSPTFINMDIEGVEPAALAGARKIIQQNLPDLAICVYHSPNHLWEIPLQVSDFNENYQLYLRNYTGYPAETVLYATCDR